MEQLFDFFGNWTWFIIAGLIFLLELLTAGIFFVWLGLAAIIVGIVNLIYPLSWQMDLILFSVLSAALVTIGRPIVMRRLNMESEQPNLNQRNRDFVGKSYRLDSPIKDGKGYITINDTRWRVRGDDVDAGTWVTVTDVDNMDLLVTKKAD